MDWFKEHGRSSSQHKSIENMVIKRFKNHYLEEIEVTPSPQPKVNQKKVFFHNTLYRTEDQNLSLYQQSWYAPQASPEKFPLDHIKTYLKEKPISSQAVKEAGGYIKYWHQALATHPQVAKMGLDFCSAPGRVNFIKYFINHF